MNIEEARKARGMSRKDVSRKLGIPYRSLENWEKGLSKCPDYVERLVVAEILKGGKKMTDIEVLMKNGYSKRKAEEELKRGTVVFEGEDFERHFDDYMEEWGVDEEEQEKYRKMLEEKIAIPDWGIVEDNGNTYYIMYCL
ncbi:helix-turn-helix domain-containing protein [[Ruminococcus] lactaris]|jgi:transcriptional regulator with XRE-family HTH domain|uniref:XRE family transcriptional regulator n=1 Tax=[Ruminococcus] lactaris TaxID=46228 RepID=A0A415D8D4_9FIRM|nr:helix-turn-helix transcriptional regulator [[Ruminococcus] lactaris]RHJ63261.1 XRE family transcriptional regulator [[Ruminococcus] lactaris]